MEPSYEVEVLRAMCREEAARAHKAVEILIENEASEEVMNTMTASAAQQNAAVFIVGAAVCERLDRLLELFEGSRPDPDMN